MNQTNDSQSDPNVQIPPAPPPGVPYQQATPLYHGYEPGRKSSALAATLSLMPGLGQVYVGHYRQGFINILVIGSLIVMLSEGTGQLAPLMGIFLAFYWLFNMVDAARRASFYNMALTRDSRAVVEDIPLPDDRASLLAGVALTFFGGLFLLHNVMDVSLEWLEDWWPLALVILGIYLIYKSVSETTAHGKADY